MATGWAPEGAVQEQIDDTIADAVKQARSGIPSGESARECCDCGELIPEARRRALAGVKFCIECQSERDSQRVFSSINRRGSKDSQLR
ncbi:DksA/TraR family C4-type zinc finger protein [Acetobacter sp.]|jgi:phage/conjugal plasmid C-4 type zinc finger TraR family protein|uniref:DksA/TraR family C4-type zinc finger protein n=1 Tax=Acetobacter sp. TaxID=440 RepID=UPI0025C095D4|nr:DksA/TraR family C4-type zinc finger protein [Acetobacter sp.]MCH4090662.1 DksA/TraR family C4-type zinc finger protein [Acetobacter sp.]MCI1300105.1 DksA/TraR family C4-type zinc finger protein [Acetobacter sp.]MCI1316523.1 DksA/TraR family C4-type zinc finger protein [Acetobacter sp.]